MPEPMEGLTPPAGIPGHGDPPTPAPATQPAARQPFRWLDLVRAIGASADARAGGEHQRLRAHVANASRILSPKGPLAGFVAQNPLQGIENLPFDKAIRDAQRLLRGRGYLSNEAFRRIFASGRITKDDLQHALEARIPHLTSRPPVVAGGRRVDAREVCLVQLLHGIAPLPHGGLRWQLVHADATRKFRLDLPAEARVALLQRSQEDLLISLERIGDRWTLSDWFHAHTNLDVAPRILDRIHEDLDIIPAAAPQKGCLPTRLRPFWHGWRAARRTLTHRIAVAPADYVARCLEQLGIPGPQRDGYRTLMDRYYAAGPGSDPDPLLTREEFAGMWLHYERQLLGELVPRHLGVQGSFAAIRRHFQQRVEAYAVSSLWAAVLEKLGLGDPVSVVEIEARATEVLLRRVFAAARDGWEAVAHLQEDHPRRLPDSPELGHKLPRPEAHLDPLASARGALQRDLERIGQDHTLGDISQRLTGTRIPDLVNEVMSRWCGAFFDEGLAGWPMPGREQGFYAAWRQLAEQDPTAWFLGIPDAPAKVRRLAPQPEDVLISILRTIGIPEEHWTDYLALHLAALPGWAAMARWREARPDYEMQEHCPVDLTQYLAVRLFYEWELVSALCRREWGIEATIQAIRAYFQAHPGEYFARSEIAAGDLPDAVATAIGRTGLGTIALNWEALTHPANGEMPQAKGLNRRERWDLFAAMLHACRHGGGAEHETLVAVCHDAWRLFQLAQLLALTAEDVRALSSSDARSLLALLDDLPPDSHGPIWLHAYETHYRDRLLAHLTDQRPAAGGEERPQAQLVFCLDVREEGLRRHLEAQKDAYETYGTAGFFSLPMIFRPLADGAAKASCPIVIRPRHAVAEIPRPGQTPQETLRRKRAHWKEALHGIYHRLETNLAAAYPLIDLLGVPFGITVAGRTLVPARWRALTGAIGGKILPSTRTRLLVEHPPEDGSGNPGHGFQGRHPPRAGGNIVSPGFSLEEQADIVENQLRLIGLTRHYARLVVFCGHGSTTQNNPYAAAYHCGACGGNRGGPNARALAAIANNPAVRTLLQRRRIAIPEDTHFLGGEHDTAADRTVLFDTEDVPATHVEDLRRLIRDLDHAGAIHAQERCRRLPRAPQRLTPEEALRHVQTRTNDWAQVYPEWGHATCALMVIGKREHTRRVFLDRRAYLQSYDPALDTDGAILEEIMSAFIPVVRGISLDYYFSTVDSGITGVLGAGTKALHNVIGLIGVLQGAGGDIKTGLPAQGVVPLHEPMRVQIIVQSHPARLSAIIERHKVLENVFKNQWAHLIAWEPRIHRFLGYQPDGNWLPLRAESRS